MAITSEKKGKMAISSYRVIEEFGRFSLLRIRIETGRMHQIRVHLAAIGHPVAGDAVYGNEKINKFLKKEHCLSRTFLHARSITFVNPLTGKKLTLETELPDDLKKVIESLSP